MVDGMVEWNDDGTRLVYHIPVNDLMSLLPACPHTTRSAALITAAFLMARASVGGRSECNCARDIR